ncbi:MAG: NADH-quinone oxidoreductase subunit L [Chloroflexi bacterium]|nr:NADH-quinone oxidoreductase subunit L [Chloroflexota bacterium]NOG36230.1 NADH-quinone oxidoreductase subunit L [Chloroflexota bacterium]GIK58171.1 MAG: NADH-quinone oxidoreductase subunit L [Chloroflexota bacterium]
MSEETLTLMTWLIPAGPLLVFFIITLFTNRNRTLSWTLAWAGVIASLVLSWTVVANMVGLDVHELAHHPVQYASSIDWLPFGPCPPQEGGNCTLWLDMGVAVDALTAIMLFMVPLAVFMIFVYSVGYHNYGQPRGMIKGVPNHGQEDPLFSRFFALMSLFAGAMLVLVVADNLLLLFVGWEIMGFCSYALIGFWYARDYHLQPGDIPHIPPRQAARKAFMTTRIADVVMLLGIVLFYRSFGTLNFNEAFTLHGFEHAIAGIGLGGIALMPLLLFTGTVGKSAQWPLHAWLPDAMEGPTPVSATIHAAAMVSAGIYMLLRIFPLVAVSLENNPEVGWIIAGIGAFTALMAATIAVAQNDVKGVLAYSTISQLGFMIAAIGVGGYIAAAFHLITHAFFKALLFLSSGSVIHGMEHGAMHVHDHHTDPQDMRYMGGLRHKMPVTFWAFLIGGMALSGLPFITAGFWSKDEIFAHAYHEFTHGNPLGLVVLVMLGLAAFLTAFYTTRQLAMTFAGKPRTPLAEHAHESNKFMTVPLVILAFFAIVLGWLGIPDHFLGQDLGQINFVHHFVLTTIEEPMIELHEAGLTPIDVHEEITWSWVPLITSLVVALGGIGAGWLVYGRKPLQKEQPDPLIRAFGPLHTFLNRKWYWDELYHVLFYRPTVWFSETFASEWVDKGVVDGTLHAIANIVYAIGRYCKRFEEVVISGGVDKIKDGFLYFARESRLLQSGRIQEYVLYSGLIAVALAFMMLFVSIYGGMEWLRGLF